MGCGGSKEDVATGNTTASAGGSKLLRRKSSVSTSHAATSSSDNSSGVAVTDIVNAKADVGEVTSTAVKDVIAEKKGDDVAKKDVANDGAAPAPAPAVVDAKVTEVAPVPDEEDQAKKQAEEEEQLPESTMADEAAAVDGPRPKLDEDKEVAHNDGEEKTEDARESKTINKDEEKATSPAPAPTNEDGKSAGQQNITEPVGVEAKPAIDEEKVAVSESSAGKKKINTDDDEQTAAAAARSEPSAN